MLKTIIPLVPAKLAYTRANENELDTDGGGVILNGNRIDDKKSNLLSCTRR